MTNSFSIRLTWIGFYWRPELRLIEDRSVCSPAFRLHPKIVGLEFHWLGFNLGLISYDFRLSNWQAGCHIAQYYFARPLCP